MLKLLAPPAGATVRISPSGEAPSIAFVTDGTGAHVWTWGFAGQAGSKVTTASQRWDAKAVIAGRGGSLAVSVTAHSGGSANTNVEVRGSNPSSSDVDAYYAASSGAEGFARIIAQESRYFHFDAGGTPTARSMAASACAS